MSFRVCGGLTGLVAAHFLTLASPLLLFFYTQEECVLQVVVFLFSSYTTCESASLRYSLILQPSPCNLRPALDCVAPSPSGVSPRLHVTSTPCYTYYNDGNYSVSAASSSHKPLLSSFNQYHLPSRVSFYLMSYSK